MISIVVWSSLNFTTGDFAGVRVQLVYLCGSVDLLRFGASQYDGVLILLIADAVDAAAPVALDSTTGHYVPLRCRAVGTEIIITRDAIKE